MSGRVSFTTSAGDPGDGIAGHHYATLMLDRPVCVLESSFGAVPRGTVVAVVPKNAYPASMKQGAHVTLTGNLAHRETGDEPPEDLQFDVSGH